MPEERVGWSLIRGALVIRRRGMVLISCFHNRQLVERTQKKTTLFLKNIPQIMMGKGCFVFIVPEHSIVRNQRRGQTM